MPPFGGTMLWASPGVAPGTSPGGRGAGMMLMNCAWASAATDKNRATANANGPPLPALVAAILIGGIL
jgi:hypothetical protein